jgi:hypothetical protein
VSVLTWLLVVAACCLLLYAAAIAVLAIPGRKGEARALAGPPQSLRVIERLAW